MNKRIKINGLKEISCLLVMALFIGVYQVNLVEQTLKRYSINIDVTDWVGIGITLQEKVEAHKIMMLAGVQSMIEGEQNLKKETIEKPVITSKREGKNGEIILKKESKADKIHKKEAGQEKPPDLPKGAAQMLSGQASNKCADECTILLLGDSLMGDVFFSLSRAAKKEGKKWKIIDAHKVSSGLTNSKYYDWPKVAGVLIEQYKPDVVAVLIGANDAQGMVEGGKAYAFGTDAWRLNYRARAMQIIEASVKAQASLLWLEMPEVGKSEFEKKIKVIREIQGEAAGVQNLKTNDVLGVKTEPLFLALRQPDGIHLNAQGAGLVAKKLINSLSIAKEKETAQLISNN